LAVDAIPLCQVGCAPSIWQQRSNAKFIAALNSGQETFAHDDTAYALAVDALTHPGPADPSRVSGTAAWTP
jgi:hypothetical protein